ncbi:hypothetical protein [Leifsonia aquatica]|uniref:hypothetical protein n=1 Tax=Leifsonia aquatica TaxID=144185 RepID=UPI000468DD2A|nr:hypothetical protein [Leifsonia aquatica]
MEERSARLLPRAGALAVGVFVLVAIGYLSCLAILLVCPSIVPEPIYWSLDHTVFASTVDDVFRVSTVSLGYWMVATAVAIGLALVITLLAGRALRALGALAALAALGGSPQPAVPASSSSGENR